MTRTTLAHPSPNFCTTPSEGHLTLPTYDLACNRPTYTADRIGFRTSSPEARTLPLRHCSLTVTLEKENSLRKSRLLGSLDGLDSDTNRLDFSSLWKFIRKDSYDCS
ncbi:hypothetical protein AVEN_124503-1 [Araneus ventricosus]|uniref:Uncharacterized protein n=1 Tax=Araneus ventricosus TaxID=182803 RepID=A0A4Y2NBM7_ARAVE|nr:hypothetical protein AVEN_124503-1 [Araneus ventricosus]